jgi:hypothetical protein
MVSAAQLDDVESAFTDETLYQKPTLRGDVLVLVNEVRRLQAMCRQVAGLRFRVGMKRPDEHRGYFRGDTT